MLLGWTAMACSLLAETELETYFYDSSGRLASVVYTTGGTNTAESYQYDLAGNRIQRTSYGPGPSVADHNNDQFLSEQARLGIDSMQLDTDRDGMTDYEEWIAGTGITNKNDAFVITPIRSLAKNSLQIAVPMRLGRVYQMQRCDSINSPWLDWGPPIEATGDKNHIFEVALPARGFFRIEVKRLP